MGEGEAATVALPTPINRFPHFLALLVQQLKAICPITGRQRVTDTLARAGSHPSASAAGRMIEENIPESKPTGTGRVECDESDTADWVTNCGRFIRTIKQECAR